MNCIQCGKTVEQENTVLCNSCFSKKHTSLKSYQEHTLLICENCGSYKYQKEWKHPKPKEEAIQEAVLQHCNFKIQPDAIDFDIKLKDEHGKVQMGTVALRTETTIDEQKLIEEHEFPVKVKWIMCDKCTRAKTEYFEGILQLRGENKQVLEKAHEFVLQEITRANEKGVFVTKMEEVTNGIDYYVTKQQYLPIITNKLVEKFGATGKTHGELYTKNRQTSKDVYRVNASVRLPSYEINTIVEYEKKCTKLTSIGKQLQGINLKNGKRVTIDEKKHMIILATPETFKRVQVTKEYPDVEILHPETYQSTKVENPEIYQKGENKEVLVAIIDEKVWII